MLNLNLELASAQLQLLTALRYAPPEYDLVYRMVDEMRATCRVVGRRAKMGVV